MQGGGFARIVARLVDVVSGYMADKDDFSEEIQRRAIGREILDAAAKEMGFAVNSIRHEVVEKAWFGDVVTPDVDLRAQWQLEPPDESPIAKQQDFSMDDLYGHDPEPVLKEQREHNLKTSLEIDR